MKHGKFEYWKSWRDKQWYWHLKAPNGQITCPSEGYKTKRGCLKGIASVKRNAALADVVQI